ncbi:MAG: peptidoglycan DD-metalloendopeptidase family protein [Aquisalimonadaceae bacterium]
MQGRVITAFSGDEDGKQGINIGGAEGQEIKAAASGRVVYSGSGLVGYGNLIILKHEDDYLTAYGYNRELLVDEGVDVAQGQVIGRMGRSGNRPMLHFELRREGRSVDPLGYLPKQR